MTLPEARQRADALRTALAPHCHRIEVAGSIRRHKTEPKDIELVCIPKQEAADLLCTEMVHGLAFRRVVAQHLHTSGSLTTGKHIKFQLPDGIKVDLFTCTADNWGWIYTLRTGSREHNIRMVRAIRDKGMRCDEGQVWRAGSPVPIPEEQHAFTLAGMLWVAPQMRTA